MFNRSRRPTITELVVELADYVEGFANSSHDLARISVCVRAFRPLISFFYLIPFLDLLLLFTAF